MSKSQFEKGLDDRPQERVELPRFPHRETATMGELPLLECSFNASRPKPSGEWADGNRAKIHQQLLGTYTENPETF